MLIAKIEDCTPVPKQINTFWKEEGDVPILFSALAVQNKQEMIISGMLVNGEQLAVVSVSGHTERHDVNSLLCNIEEADQRLIKHIHWSAVNGNQSFIVRSYDSDVLLLLVHYFKAFKMAGLK